ncbi:MAG: hypothetical protein DMG37_16055 [Acidobacteria bacterium]|nr:MAG: hypothetical protein DMG37_16055 [Acidobacteriota bacterium]
MRTSRVLLISNVRPSRTWNFANRLLREVPGTQICGVVQRPMRSIPWIQQLIATGKTREISLMPRQWSKVRFLFHSFVDKVVAWFFWFVHGCPPSPNDSTFNMKRLRQECARAGWLFIVTGENKEAGVAALSLGDVDLTIVLGEFFPLPDSAVNASNGCIRASILNPGKDVESSRDDIICIAGHSEAATTAVSQWAIRVLAPSLSQLNGAEKGTFQTETHSSRCRSVWRLCLDTLLLLSPSVLGRNWYRRLTGRYPVLILAHHLVSDRPHRMGVPTETFWRQVLFLRKHYRIVSLAEASDLLRSRRIRIPTVVLTFDDGYADNFLGLRAVANETETSSTLFVTTGPVEAHREFDHDLAKDRKGFLPLTWDQIAYWNTRGAEFGSHTREHFDCGSTDLEHLQSEIIGSRQDLEAHVKKPVTFFAFPYGKQKNMSRLAMDLAASTYRHYVSSYGGESLANGGSPQSHLFRKKFYGSPWELELELQSVFDFVDALKQRFHSQAASPSNEPDRVPVVSTLSPSIQTITSSSTSTAAYSHVKDSYGIDSPGR